MLAPEAIATAAPAIRSGASRAMRFKPASARAPDGSSTDRVSRNASLIAAQISSTLTVKQSSRWRWQSAKVSSTDSLAGTPSATPPHGAARAGAARPAGLGHGAAVVGLHPHDAHRRPQLLHPRRDAGRQAA